MFLETRANVLSSSDWEPNDGQMVDLNGSTAAPPLILLQPLREGVEHFSEFVTPDPPCHFCRENISRPVHEDCTRLKIVSRGKSHREEEEGDCCCD